MKWVFLGLAFFFFVSYFAQKEGIHNASTTTRRMDSVRLAKWSIYLTIVFFVAFIISCLF
ncbi:MAG: hypothetical protein U9N18_01980 [Campylobacterota bacterium]|nr:hypothetical protein [Campylobacterota bacterium]